MLFGKPTMEIEACQIYIDNQYKAQYVLFMKRLIFRRSKRNKSTNQTVYLFVRADYIQYQHLI